MKGNLLKKGMFAKNEEEGQLFKQMPSWWVTLFAYLLAGLFCHYSHIFFAHWFPPYLYEVFKNLRSLPIAWADLGLYWAERGLQAVAILAALYHQLWQLGTRYILNEQELKISMWFPSRRVVTIPIGAIRRYSYHQNWFALLLGFGMVEIDAAATTLIYLPDCPKVSKLMDLMKVRVDRVFSKNA